MIEYALESIDNELNLIGLSAAGGCAYERQPLAVTTEGLIMLYLFDIIKSETSQKCAVSNNPHGLAAKR